MPLAVVVHGISPHLASLHAEPAEGERVELVFDSPKILIGRGEGCDVRLPDSSVSPRHATIRARGSEYVLVDESSTNGTRHQGVRLAPAVPTRIGPREIVRFGRVWVELRHCQSLATKSVRDTAKEVALALVAADLEARGEPAGPRVLVTEGPDAGREAAVIGSLVVGRSSEADLQLADPELSRRHVEVLVRGDNLVVRDLGSKRGSTLEPDVGRANGGAESEERGGGEPTPLVGDTVWRAGRLLRIGGTALSFEFPAAEALRERERAPDRALPHEELDYVLPRPAVETPAPAELAPETELTPSPPPEEARPRYRGPTWSITDFAVALLAVGVFSLSAVGYLVLLR
jgi:pSer/pThr/pTyr-binding forkhead associated (FHA) protein